MQACDGTESLLSICAYVERKLRHYQNCEAILGCVSRIKKSFTIDWNAEGR